MWGVAADRDQVALTVPGLGYELWKHKAVAAPRHRLSRFAKPTATIQLHKRPRLSPTLAVARSDHLEDLYILFSAAELNSWPMTQVAQPCCLSCLFREPEPFMVK